MKIVCSKTASYNQAGQANPIRWRILYRVDDGENFIDQSDWFMCKDYFNDMVAKWNDPGSSFSVYGFDNSNIKFNDKSLYVYVKGIVSMDSFLKNLATVNDKFVKDMGGDGVGVLPVDDKSGEFVLKFPPEAFKNTMVMSLLTLAIRISNNTKVSIFGEWKDFWTSPLCQYPYDNALGGESRTRKQAIEGFRVPASIEKYWYYCGKTSNSELQPRTSPSIIHNNGIQSWVAYFTGAIPS